MATHRDKTVEIAIGALQRGDSAAFDHSKILEKAILRGDAQIHNFTVVRGFSVVDGNAVIKGDGLIEHTHDHLVLGPAISSGRYTTAHRDTKIGIRINCGCFSGTLKEFKARIKQTHGYNKTARKQYLGFARLIKEHFNLIGSL